MKALEPQVLQAALRIQNKLLGATLNFNPAASRYPMPGDQSLMERLTPEVRDSFHAVHGLSEYSWWFHSPLLYWSGSEANILADTDILETVNHGSNVSTPINITLRHSVVFSGKRFEDHRLVAADALVITLIHKLDSPVGRDWARRAEDLALNASGPWTIFPTNGQARSSNIYEFRFQPLSLFDDFVLGLAYSMTSLYFVLSLRRLQAMKSQIGLTTTVITQIAVSILSSLSVCAVLKIDLSKIPREAYPLVVLALSLENIFRLVNAVISTSSSHRMAVRMAEALGQTGPVALAGVIQNLFILWMLYKVVSPGVGAFCIFAGIALIFDYLYFLTFFVAVLSVDVRRTELSDALARAGRRKSEKIAVSSTPTWSDMPASTRIAGTMVMIGFVLIAQWHFFDLGHSLRNLYRLIGILKPNIEKEATSFSFLNQARSPTAWLRLQDHETAREIIRVIKPNGHSYLAEVYEPLVVVVNGSDRTPTNQGIRPFLPAAYDFLRNRSSHFIVTVLFVVAAVSLLMNYLLWDEERFSDEANRKEIEDDPPLLARTLKLGHALDVAILECSSAGILASVGLDRVIRIWDIKLGVSSHLVDSQHAPMGLFPISAIALDYAGNWLAVASANGDISLWDTLYRRWGPVANTNKKGNISPPVACFFRSDEASPISPLIMVHRNGTMSQMHFPLNRPSVTETFPICRSPLVCGRQFWERVPGAVSQPLLHLVTASRRGCVHVVTQTKTGWVSEGIDTIWPKGNEGVLSVLPLPKIRCFLAVRVGAVDLVDLETHSLLHTFSSEGLVPSSLRCFHATPKRSLPIALEYFALVYSNSSTNQCKMVTYLPAYGHENIHLDSNDGLRDSTSCAWNEAITRVNYVERPGDWEVLVNGSVVGVRKVDSDLSGMASLASTTSSLRFRAGRGIPSNRKSLVTEWEAWTLTYSGDFSVIPLHSENDNQHLLATSCGPISRVGQRSIVVGLGNSIRVISAGLEKYNNGMKMDEDLIIGVAGRRKKQFGGTKTTAACGTGAVTVATSRHSIQTHEEF